MLDYLVIAAYLGGLLIYGIVCGGTIRSVKQFAVAEQGYGTFVVFATLSASFIGGGFSMGNAAKAYEAGIGYAVALCGFSLKEIFVGGYVAPRMGRFRSCISPGQIMGKVYGHNAQVVTGLLSLITCAGVVGAQVGAIGHVFKVFLGLPQLWGVLISCGIVILYCTMGGIKAVVTADVVQFMILSIGMPLALGLALSRAGGWDAVAAGLPAEYWDITHGTTLIGFVSLFASFMLGEALAPPYIQRLLIGRRTHTAARAAMIGGVFSVAFFAVSAGIGLTARVLYPGLYPSLAMPTLIQRVLPLGLRGFVIAGVISIVMSTADSFLNAAAVGAVRDVWLPLAGRCIGEAEQLKAARTVNLLTGVAAVFFALLVPDILDLLLFTYRFWAPVILIPLVAALMGKRVNKESFGAAALAGACGMVLWSYGLSEPWGISGLPVGVAVNGLVFWLANRLSGTR